MAKQFFDSMGYDDWFGLAGLVAVILGAGLTAWISKLAAQKAGKQKIAEARLDWSNRYKDLSLELDKTLLTLERNHMRLRARTLFTDRLRVETRQIVTEMFYMTNPESSDEAASDEYEMEVKTLNRLARLGVSVDMDYIRTHRKVLKHNWRRAKSEM